MRAAFAPVSYGLLGSLALARRVSDPVDIVKSARHKAQRIILTENALNIIDSSSRWSCQPQSISFRARPSRGRITGLAEERGVGPGEGGEDHITIGEKKRWAKFP